MINPQAKLVPCRHPGQGMNHTKCPTCQGKGLLIFEPETGELRPCTLKQECDPFRNEVTPPHERKSPPSL